MRIRKPKLTVDDDRTKLSVVVERNGAQEQLWYSVDRKYEDCLSTERQDAFLVALLLPAMQKAEDIYLDGTVSEKLFYNLTNYYSKIVELALPRLHKVKIVPERLESERLLGAKDGIATSFSGGVDSFCSLADHSYARVPKGYHVNHLVLNNTGSHTKGGRDLFERRYRRLLPCAQELGIPFIAIDSNLDEILEFAHQETHTVRNLSAALILQGLFEKYLYPSTYQYADCFFGESCDIAYCDPGAIHDVNGNDGVYLDRLAVLPG